MSVNDTIFALSSGLLPSGVAVIRVSGSATRFVLEKMFGTVPAPRMAVLGPIRDPRSSEVIDRGLVLFFSGPRSFTGEDCCEFQLHGGQAVVRKCLEVLGGFAGCRLAEAGEFARRAFENGKLDLTEIEGLADLISADTELQRQQAVQLSSGAFKEKLESWRKELIRCRAFLEAEFDFSDEEDIPDSVADRIVIDLEALKQEISGFLESDVGGELVRDGFRVAITGRPNAGKSSLLNALAQRDIAIVSDEAGTTRDILEVKIDLKGLPVILYDTAGIRQTESKIEREGIRRAVERAGEADLVIWLTSEAEGVPVEFSGFDVMSVISKRDLGGPDRPEMVSLSVVEPGGLDDLLDLLGDKLMARIPKGGGSLVSRIRYRRALEECMEAITRAISVFDQDRVLSAEELRSASHCLGRVSGRVDVEDLLDVVFSEFCVGK